MNSLAAMAYLDSLRAIMSGLVWFILVISEYLVSLLVEESNSRTEKENN